LLSPYFKQGTVEKNRTDLFKLMNWTKRKVKKKPVTITKVVIDDELVEAFFVQNRGEYQA